ncbi:MAG: oligopeptide transport system substrate-binding protein [Thermomicrobiales bacterium]|jgi:oligopeptide transport system substrate-binding protein|nr:oligopeptide transport system substrate-binding protein [Thermomicrobiales bacterium]
MTRSKPAVRAMFAFLLLTLLSPIAAVGTEAQSDDKILRVRQPYYPDTLDPQKTSFIEEISVSVLDYEGLTRLDKQQQTVPAAAESWEFNADGTVVTFHLRAGLTYADGSPLTAERFRYAAERACDPNTAAAYAGILFDVVGCQTFAESHGENAEPGAYDTAKANLGVKALDDRTLEVRLTRPVPYFPTIAYTWVFFPVKQEIVEQSGEQWWQDPANRIGNGPYSMTRLEPNQLIAFEANDRYWNGRPRLDGIEFVYIDDAAVALEAYKAGDLHVTQLDSSLIPAIQNDPVLNPEVLKYAAAVTIKLAMDLKSEPFNDKKVREAFAYALDRETFCNEIRNGDCTATLSWIPEGVPGAIETDAYAFDPEKAREALAQSSYGGPDNFPPVTFTYLTDDPAERPRAEWLAGQYRDILGVMIELEGLDSTTLASLAKEPETFPQLLWLGWGQDYPDPQNWLSIYWTCDTTLYARQSGYCNAQFDEIIARADQELHPETRIGLYEEAGRLLVADVPAVFVYNMANVFLVKPEVSGYVPTSADATWPGQWTSLLTVDLGAAAA